MYKGTTNFSPHKTADNTNRATASKCVAKNTQRVTSE